MSQNDIYQGTDNLEVMAAAHRYNAFLIALIESCAPAQGTVLDFGAGTGTFSRPIKTPTRKVACLELDPSLAKNLTKSGFEVHVSTQTIPDSSCDFIYSLNVIEHIEDDHTAVAEMFRILKPGGKALIYVPALQVLYSAMDRKVGHFRRYDIKGLRHLLEQNEFTVRKGAYADSLGFFATLAYKWFGNDDGGLNMKSLILYDRVIFPLSRILDLVAHPFFGKNVFALASKPEGAKRDTPAPIA